MASPFAIPAGYEGNPFTYLQAVAAKIANPTTPTPGFRARLITLMCLMIYVITVSLVHFSLTSLDYQRKGRKWWVFRAITRPSGKFIVGNQQLFAPLLSGVCAIAFLVHIISEYLVFFARGDLATNTIVRIIPWTFVFLHGWIISWASLQAFLLTSRREGIMSAKVANGLFVGLGALGLVVLLGFDIVEIYGLVRFWKKFDVVCKLLADYAPLYGPNVDTAPQLWLAQVHFQQLIDEWSIMIKYTYGLLSVFAVTPFLTSLVNLGSLGLVMILRRQINFNFKSIRATSRFDTRAGEDMRMRQNSRQNSLTSIEGEIEEESMVMNELAYIPQGNSPRVGSEKMSPGGSQEETVGGLKVAKLAPLKAPTNKFADRVRRLSFAILPTSRVVSSIPIRLAPNAPGTGVPSTTNDARYSEKFSAIVGAVDETEQTLSDLVVQEGGTYRVKLSRSRIRRMAKHQRNSLDGEALNHLNDLLRAERDLIVTGTNIFTLSVAFSVLSIWVCVNLETVSRTWVSLEMSLFLGTYLYGVVVSIALTINCYTAYRHLTSPEPKPIIPRTSTQSSQNPFSSKMLVHSPRTSEEVKVDSPAIIGFLISPTVMPKVTRSDHSDFFPSSRKEILLLRVASRRNSDRGAKVGDGVVDDSISPTERNDGLDFVEDADEASQETDVVGRDAVVEK